MVVRGDAVIGEVTEGGDREDGWGAGLERRHFRAQLLVEVTVEYVAPGGRKESGWVTYQTRPA